MTAQAKSDDKPRDPPLLTLRYAIEYGLLRLVIGVLRLMPIETASSFMGAMWAFFAPHLHRHQRAHKHMAIAMPELSFEERDAILRRMWRHLGMTFAEGMMLDRIFAEPERIDYSDIDVVKYRNSAFDGQVYASMHLGNWEASILALLGKPEAPAAIYRRVNNVFLDRYILKSREPYYRGGMFAKSQGAARALLRLAKAGHSTAMVADLPEWDGVAVPFFGIMSEVSPFPAMLARMYGRPLVAQALVRDAPGRFRMELTPIEVPVTDDREADILKATADMQAAFESYIRRWPDQWMWATKRFG